LAEKAKGFFQKQATIYNFRIKGELDIFMKNTLEVVK
jgi:hypothetical protein